MYVDRLREKDIIVVDMTHGGIQLCDSYRRYGANVVAVDVHRTLSPEEKERLSSKSISVCENFGEAASSVDPFLVSMQYSPDREAITSHCGKEGIPLLTHARATGLMLSGILKGKSVAEVTGAYGKTTTISHIESIVGLTNKETLVMSSRCIKIVDGESVQVLDRHGSITPAYALKAVHMAAELGFDPDRYIFEISLGGLGIGSVGAVLGVPLHLEVGIQRSAFFSKAQMAQYLQSGSVLCLNADDGPTRRMEAMTSANVNTFSVMGDGNVRPGRTAVYPGDGPLGIEAKELHTCQGRVIDASIEFLPDPAFFGRAAVSNFLAAASIAMSMGIDEGLVAEGLEMSRPLENRLVSSSYGDHIVISSTATSKETIENAISEAERYAGIACRPLSLLIGGKARTTCGKVDFDGLSEVLKGQMNENRELALYGELGNELVSRGCGRHSFDSKLSAMESIGKGGGGVILSCTN